VLREVYDALECTDAPVDVICEREEKSSPDEVMEFLEKIGAEFTPGNHTDYYVFARLLDGKQAKRIDATAGKRTQCIRHVFLDKPMQAFVSESGKTINARAAAQVFETDGTGVHWAVLDTGIDTKHKLLKKCCALKPPLVTHMNFTDEEDGDLVGHGTHVAGIISQIAPGVKIHDFKVLGVDGGSSQTIIKAMHTVRAINFSAPEPVIHGINMSLGGPVPVGSYGCGWSPECREANRLMSSGVVVCVAASNDGYKTLATAEGGQLSWFRTYMDMGISDPGNAEEIITVGSTHKTHPHSYGPSFFSSKGPTGDGRAKPDCVAPGEKISSAKAGSADEMTDMSGTSMATPHVAGAVALFLAAKPEFRGRAAEIKRILMESCTDLSRDRYFQGAGMVDVLRMIESV